MIDLAKIIVKEPNKDIVVVDIPSKDVWQYMRNAVCEGEGIAVLDRVHLADPPYTFTLYVDDEGKLKNYPLNFKMQVNNRMCPIEEIVGTACFARGKIVDDDIEYTDVTEQDIFIVRNIIAVGKML